jgi:transglutaminase-like putative cysteine protease
MEFDPVEYLGECDVIDAGYPDVKLQAARLAGSDVRTTVRNCFRFVRDEIKHSADYQLNPVTCRASEVLSQGTGYCYAKSHLLCALLRANCIPAGLCYQRLSIDGVGSPYCLHGLNAVYLSDSDWYRLDARGNRDGIDAQFTPPIERLAFSTKLPGELDLPGIYSVPMPIVVDALRRYSTWDALYRNLPDVANFGGVIRSPQ